MTNPCSDDKLEIDSGQAASNMESCINETQNALLVLSQEDNLSKRGVAAALLMLRHNTRILSQSSHVGRQQIYRARAAFDSMCLERDACAYERRCLEEEMNHCVSTKYAFTLLLEQPDDAHIEEQLNNELILREAAIKERQERILQRHILVQSLQEKQKQLGDLGGLLSTMLEGGKSLEETFGYRANAANPETLADLYSKLAHLLHSQGHQCELHYSPALEEAESGSGDDLRMTFAEHISLKMPSSDLVLSFVMTDEHLVSLELHSPRFASIHQSESWYLHLPLDGAFLLTIPCEHGFALRWVNALASTLPDSSFRDDDIVTILSVISTAFDYRCMVMAHLSGARVDGMDVNHIMFEHGSLKIKYPLNASPTCELFVDDLVERNRLIADLNVSHGQSQ